MDYSSPGSSVHRDSLGKDTGVGCHFLLQGIFPSQGSNPGLPHCRGILYCLSHQGSPRTLEWIAISFSRRTYQSKDQTLVFWSADKFFTTELPGKPHIVFLPQLKKQKRLTWYVRSFILLNSWNLDNIEFHLKTLWTSNERESKFLQLTVYK